MSIEQVRELLEQRECFNRRIDQEIKAALGIPTDGTTVGLSIDDGFVGSHIPATVPPEKGWYRLIPSSLTKRFEVVAVDSKEVILMVVGVPTETVFRLSLEVFEALFTPVKG